MKQGQVWLTRGGRKMLIVGRYIDGCIICIPVTEEFQDIESELLYYLPDGKYQAGLIGQLDLVSRI
jgi:hypothetical protein